MCGVIGPDTTLKRRRAQYTAQHVECPTSLLIRVGAGDVLHATEVLVNDGIGRVFGGKAHDGVATGVQTAEELIPAICVFDVEQCEVGGKAFAEPHVIPICFGDGVPKPLMRDFVNDHVAPPHAAGA